MMKRAFALAAAVAVLGACGPSGTAVERFADNGRVPVRRGAAVIDSCSLDPSQTATLQSDAARNVITEVILFCLSATETGAVSPTDPIDVQRLMTEIQLIKGMGYRVSLGLGIGDAVSAPYVPGKARALLVSGDWRSGVVAAVSGTFAPAVDGIEMILPPLADLSSAGVTVLASDLSKALRPAVSLGVFVPPSVRSPSDVPGGDSYDIAALSGSVDRIRVMTMDYSCCNGPDGPSIDPGWAVDAVRFASNRARGVPVDVAVPLFGTDFSDLGDAYVDYPQSTFLAGHYEASVRRGPTGEPTFGYTDEAGHAHVVWYEDATSLRRTLSAWDTTVLLPDVGVVYRGLGSEDPALWSTLAEGMR